ncbi:MAG: hypothetical protein OQL11_06360 [Gammaproteobacteria bacterium]|nr:hypothetical protein [Gammaproteobacteria bacterium]
MGNRIASIMLSLLFSASVVASDSSLEEKIQSLNDASIKSVGISLNALAYLVSASPNSYMPLWHLEQSGEIAYIKELEKAGYVKVNITEGLPDGQMRGEKQVNIVPLHSGLEVQRCMLALKHNNSTQPTQ